MPSYLEPLAWQGFRLSCLKEPGKDSNGLTTIIPVGTMPVSPAGTSILAPRPSIGGNDATIGDLSTLEDEAAVKEVIKSYQELKKAEEEAK